MRFTVVDKKEFEKKCEQKKLKYVFMEFINMNVKVAKVNFSEFDYKNMNSAYNNLHKGAIRHRVPVRVTRMGDSIYFVRKDI